MSRPSLAHIWAPLVAFLVLSAPCALTASSSGDSDELEAPAFKILIEQDGVYRVDYQDLANAGLESPLPSESLAIGVAGEAVPLWLADGGDGEFGPGDHVEFVGRRLVGERSWVHDYAWFNVYRLSADGVVMRMKAGLDAPGEAEEGVPRVHRRLEQDEMLLRLPGARFVEEDPWFWAKMVHNRPEPTRVALDLTGLDPKGKVDLVIEVRGWSRPHNKASEEVFDHSLAIKLGNLDDGRERILGVESWNGGDARRIELKELDARWFGASSELRLSVPMRKEAQLGRAIIDVTMLNFVELTYDHSGQIPERGERLEWDHGKSVRLAAGQDLLVFGEKGTRLATVSHSPRQAILGNGERAAWIVPPDRLRRPARVIVDTPSALSGRKEPADYLMITPHEFRAATEPLAALHRSRGLAVEIIDVEDIYDEFNHGIAHPRAIRDFVAHAFENWPEPAPRFVLLVGDASWDVKNAEGVDAHYADWTYRRGESRDFAKNESTPYEGATGRSRHFIPTWQTSTGQGHAASDNYFVDVDSDGTPELAIGRLPVASVEELEPIVRKIERYVREPVPGDWRKGVLFVTNEQKRYQYHSDRLAKEVEEAGFTPQKIYPVSTEKSNAQNTEDLVDAIGNGQLLVHFIGHGGRYIWRTGPPDLEKNHDLFTLDDLDRLPSNDRLPVVVSLTCYSAPFDHPTADSIGEKFLRIDGRGAIGVIAASWRNSPNYNWGKLILSELMRPGGTVGEALMVAKKGINNRMFRETYLLLGDPAVPVALPPLDGDSAVAQQEEPREAQASEDKATGLSH